jgi:hypothetical protein
MPIILKGATSGQVTLDTPAIAGTNNLELPAATGTIQLLKLETSQATTSGTFKDFLNIPSWAKKITVMFNGVSTNGTSIVQIQLGTSGGIQSTGYITETYSCQDGGTGRISATTGHTLTINAGSTDLIRGTATYTLLDASNGTWVSTSYVQYRTGVVSSLASSIKTLSGTLDRVRITTVGGTDTFDAGSVNILIEGN